MQADGLILAGGKGTRMDGKYKGGLKYGEETFMNRLMRELQKEAGKIYVSYGTHIHETYDGCMVIMDEYVECGPIGGLHAGLKMCEQEMIMVAACDMPLLGIELYRFLWEQIEPHDQGVVPVAEGRLHPLAAIYKKEIMQIVVEQIEEQDYRLTGVLDRLNIRYVDLSEHPKFLRMLQNINTVTEYAKLAGEGGTR